MFLDHLICYQFCIDLVYTCRRPPIIYDKKEVKQWVQARKKNYPTSANINKVNVYTFMFFISTGQLYVNMEEALTDC